VTTDAGIQLKQSVGVDGQILMPWRHWTPKIESLSVLDARQI